MTMVLRVSSFLVVIGGAGCSFVFCLDFMPQPHKRTVYIQARLEWKALLFSVSVVKKLGLTRGYSGPRHRLLPTPSAGNCHLATACTAT